MKRIAVVLLIASLVLASAIGEENKLENGDFSGGLKAWGTYLEGGAAKLAVDAEGNGQLTISKVGSVVWGVQLTHDGISLAEGSRYRLSFEAASTTLRTGVMRIQKNGTPYTGYCDKEISLTPELQAYTIDFTMTDASDPAARLVFNLGVEQTGGKAHDAHVITLAHFSLILLEGDEIKEGGPDAMPIQINQLGYTPKGPKLATLTGNDAVIKVIDTASGQAIYTLTPGDAVYSASAGQMVRTVDFSLLETPGTYVLRCQEGDSAAFEIKDAPYQAVRAAVLDMLNIQQCGVAVDAGAWSHPACHTADARIYGTDQYKDVSGGWHDAGDYGRYVVPAAKTVADLLWTVEFGFADPAEVLPVVKFELDWLLKMQDAANGGVYHKVTAASFCGFIMPEEEKDELILCPVSAAATADFAAVMAMASLHYDDARLIAAAERAWSWLEANPAAPGFVNPEGIVTGEYGDENTTDERYFAACALYRATGKDIYHDALKALPASEGLGWADVGDYGNVEYLLTAADKTDAALRRQVLEAFLRQCDRLLLATKAEPYGVSLGTDYPWGSNMIVANNAMILLMGDYFAKNAAYVEAALEHVHYLFGRNALAQSFVTGFGQKAAEHPHHRPSQAVGAAVPGMVVGGPEAQLQDPYIAAVLKDMPPAKCYADNDQSYASNEVTIYWNSPVYFVLAGLEK